MFTDIAFRHRGLRDPDSGQVTCASPVTCTALLSHAAPEPPSLCPLKNQNRRLGPVRASFAAAGVARPCIAVPGATVRCRVARTLRAGRGGPMPVATAVGGASDPRAAPPTCESSPAPPEPASQQSSSPRESARRNRQPVCPFPAQPE